jgi:phospholipid/cholesterol/gamma-HCH transport system substrate-binding protein
MVETEPRRRLKVGLFTGSLVVLLGIIVLLLGKRQGIFERHVRYLTRFEHASGVVPGAAVWLDGVVVGTVEAVELPSDPRQREITIVFRITARVADRVRADSKVQIRTLGLLGDRYLELSSGSPEKPALEAEAVVPSQEATDLEAALARGGDALTNILAISSSLRRILERVERGEGVLGELTAEPESGRKVVARLASVLEQADALLHDVRAGKGVLGRLIADPALETQLVNDLAATAKGGRQVAEAMARDLARDDSVIAGLLRDPQGRARVQRTLDGIADAALGVAAVSKQLREGQGTLPRVMNDAQFARAFLDDLSVLTYSLRAVAEKLDHGTGTAGILINDPGLARDLENVVRGIERSKLKTWYIRSARKAGEAANPLTPTPTPTTAAKP